MGFFKSVGKTLGKAAPIVATGGLSLASSLFNRGSGMPTADITGDRALIDNSAMRQSDLATGLKNSQLANANTYKGEAFANADKNMANARLSSENFLKDVGSVNDKLGENLSNALYRRTMASQPAMSDALRENLAGTGGLNRGAADQAFIKQNADLASKLFEGNQDIVNSTMDARLGATEKAYGYDQGLIRDRLGIDQDVLAKVYATGDSALIREAESLIGIDDTKKNDTLDAMNFKRGADIAKAKDASDSKRGLVDSLLKVGGTAAGGFFGGPAGAAAGSQLGGAASSPRGTVDSSSFLNSPYRRKSSLNLY